MTQNTQNGPLKTVFIRGGPEWSLIARMAINQPLKIDNLPGRVHFREYD